MLAAPPQKKHLNRLVSSAIVLTLVGGVIASAAFARVARNTVDPVAIVTDNGRLVTVTGPITCDESQTAELHVTVTQRSTGAVAEGRAPFTCTGDIQQWEVRAATQGKAALVQGPASAVALATTSKRGNTDDAHQWLVEITLVRE
jgi:hypothetical protein